MTKPRNQSDSQRDKAQKALNEVLEENPIKNGPASSPSHSWYEDTGDYCRSLIDIAYASGYASGLAPKSVAASAYYAGRIMTNRAETQHQVADKFGVHFSTIKEHYENLLILGEPGEGWGIPSERTN